MIRRHIGHAAPIAALVLVFVLAPAAMAGKGGRWAAADPTLLSDCNPCALGSTAHFTGSGYDGSQGSALVSYKTADATISAMVPVSADGTLSFAWTMSPAGTKDFCVYQRDNSGKWVLRGETTVTVQ